MSPAPRFFCPLPLAAGPLTLPPETTRHIQVRRLQPGDALVLFDGAGCVWQARLAHMTRSQASAHLEHALPCEPASQYRVHLAIGMPANERMDWVIEKATELGAASITPLRTARSVAKPSGERAARRLQHWQGMAAAACAQSGRNHLPTLHPIADVADWLHALAESAPPTMARQLLHTQSSPMLPVGAEPRLLLCGPEGGLTVDEVQHAITCGFAATSLGPLTLRSDTAAIAALARCVIT
jgi:16S rRNA (uracil1498-N3)-methyltransferase